MLIASLSLLMMPSGVFVPSAFGVVRCGSLVRGYGVVPYCCGV